MHQSTLLRKTTEEHPLTPLTLAPTHPTFVMGKLTARESEVAELLMKGISYVEIGKQLNIGRRTVKAHVARMLERFNIHGCAHPRVALAVLLSQKP